MIINIKGALITIGTIFSLLCLVAIMVVNKKIDALLEPDTCSIELQDFLDMSSKEDLSSIDEQTAQWHKVMNDCK